MIFFRARLGAWIDPARSALARSALARAPMTTAGLPLFFFLLPCHPSTNMSHFPTRMMRTQRTLGTRPSALRSNFAARIAIAKKTLRAPFQRAHLYQHPSSVSPQLMKRLFPQPLLPAAAPLVEKPTSCLPLPKSMPAPPPRSSEKQKPPRARISTALLAAALSARRSTTIHGLPSTRIASQTPPCCSACAPTSAESSRTGLFNAERLL